MMLLKPPEILEWPSVLLGVVIVVSANVWTQSPNANTVVEVTDAHKHSVGTRTPELHLDKPNSTYPVEFHRKSWGLPVYSRHTRQQFLQLLLSVHTAKSQVKLPISSLRSEELALWQHHDRRQHCIIWTLLGKPTPALKKKCISLTWENLPVGVHSVSKEWCSSPSSNFSSDDQRSMWKSTMRM